MAIPRGITREDVERALRDFDMGAVHPYGTSTRYDLVVKGRRYPPKAIVGFAARRLNAGRFLDPDADFSGGEGRSAANRVLRDLGYTVVEKGRPLPASGRQSSGRDWSDAEIEIVLDGYVALLQREMAGQPAVKREVTRALEMKLPGRTIGSIEFKMQNISAVLHEEALPWIEGYKPLRNYQHALADAVRASLERNATRDALESVLQSVPALDEIPEPSSSLEVSPPNLAPRRDSGTPGTRLTQLWRGALSDGYNRRLGQKGEQWILELERTRLREADRAQLAKRVEWVSQTKGDGLGYDILSFDETGRERWLEVKTTNAGKSAPFLITPNELGVWKLNLDRYELVRVFWFSGATHFYRVAGSPDDRLDLSAASWFARPT